MNEYTLVLLAAGKGSRFGGLKQLHTFEPQGATLAEFALWDAWQLIRPMCIHSFRFKRSSIANKYFKKV